MTFSEYFKKSQEVNEANKGTYKEFFKGMLKKYKIKSPSELSKEDKVKFYDEIDAGWDAENETDLDESKLNEKWWMNKEVASYEFKNADKDFFEIWDDKMVIAYPKKVAQRGITFKTLDELNKYLAKYFDYSVTEEDYKKIQSKLGI